MLVLYCAYFLRFEGSLRAANQIEQYILTVPLVFFVKLPVCYMYGLYRGMWRYTSTSDLANIIKATLISSFLIVVAFLYINRFEGLSRSIFSLDAIFTFLFGSGHRVVIRYFNAGSNGPKRFAFIPFHSMRKRLLLSGAGDATAMILRELRTNTNLPYLPVALVDDAPGIQHRVAV